MHINDINYEAQPPLIRLMLDVRRIDAQIVRLREGISQVEAYMRKCTSRLTGMPRSGQSVAWDDLIQQKDELRAEIQNKQAERLRLAQVVATSPDCDRLELDEYRVLCMRYMTGHSLAETALELHMGKTTVYEAEQRALAKIRTIPNESERFRTI